MLYKEEKKNIWKKLLNKGIKEPKLKFNLGSMLISLQPTGSRIIIAIATKPLLSGTPNKQTLSIKQTLSQVPKLSLYF